MKIVNIWNGEKSIKVETDAITAGVTYTTLKEYEDNFRTNVQLIEQGAKPYEGFAKHFKKYGAFVKATSSYYNEFYEDTVDEIAEDLYAIEVKYIVNGEEYVELYMSDMGLDADFDYNEFLTALDKGLQRDEISINIADGWVMEAHDLIYRYSK